MDFDLPGQLRGPECRAVISRAIALRRWLAPWFLDIGGDFKRLTMVLRVDGSLGSFGKEGIENIRKSGRELSCELVIADHDWSNLENAEVARIVSARVTQAIVACLDYAGISFNRKSLHSATRGAT